MNYIKVHQNKIMKGFVLLFLIAMLLFPAASFQGASSGLLLWFHNVLPNLLPFIIISNLIIRLNITQKLSKVFYPVLGRLLHISCEGCYPIVIGFLSGIPMGAKSTADLIAENRIHKKEGQFLFSMCNNASPMFIIGYIAITQLKLPHIKYALFGIIYGSAILSALIYRFFSNSFSKKDTNSSISPVTSNNIKSSSKRFTFDILDSSIMNGFEIVTKIGGYIILFSILAQIIKEIGPDNGFFKAFFMGIFEITTGINQVCNTNADINTKIVLVSVLTSFGGFSGVAQTKSVLGDSRLSMNSYIMVKLISAAISLLLALLYVRYFRF
jgi:sporulation integral membrane protein YlbJ